MRVTAVVLASLLCAVRAPASELPVMTDDAARNLGLAPGEYRTPETPSVEAGASAGVGAERPTVRPNGMTDEQYRLISGADLPRGLTPVAPRKGAPTVPSAPGPRREPKPGAAPAGPAQRPEADAPAAPPAPPGDGPAPSPSGTADAPGAVPPKSAQAPRMDRGSSSKIESRIQNMKGALGGLAADAGKLGGPAGPGALGAPTPKGPAAPAGPGAPASSGDPSAPRTREDLLASVSAGYGATMRDMGLRAGPGPDGRRTILDGSGRPASDAQLAQLSSRIGEEPRALMRRPDLYDVVPRGRYQDLQGAYAASGGARPEFQDIGVQGRDFAWKRSCDRVSGGCNPLSAEKSYKQNSDVSPETLSNVWKKLREDAPAGDDDGWADYVKEQRKAYDEGLARESRAEGIRAKLARSVFGAGTRLAGMLGSLAGSVESRGGDGVDGPVGGAAAAARGGEGFVSYGDGSAGAPAAKPRARRGAAAAGERDELADLLPPDEPRVPWGRVLFAVLGAGALGAAARFLLKRRDEDARVRLAPLPAAREEERKP